VKTNRFVRKSERRWLRGGREMRIDKLIGVEKIDYMAREVVMDELEEFRLIGVI
jgi:hypothetical protein